MIETRFILVTSKGKHNLINLESSKVKRTISALKLADSNESDQTATKGQLIWSFLVAITVGLLLAQQVYKSSQPFPWKPETTHPGTAKPASK